MRTAIFIVGAFLNNGFQVLAQSNGYEIVYTDAATPFVVLIFLLLFAMDVAELVKKMRTDGKQ
jgi:hypothetical protein